MPSLRPVLIVEDNPNDLELTVAALKQAGLANEIAIARDGEQALDYLFRRGGYADRATAQPAVIVLDLKMPKVDGHEVLQKIRADPDLRLIPTVVLTSSREEQDLYQCYDQGANAYVVKPVDFQSFSLAVSKLGLFWAVANEPPPDGSVAH